MPRKLRFAVAAALLVLLAVSAGSARAAVRMPIGFYDDASFRWSTVNTTNLEAAQKANASIIHVLADWSQIAPTQARLAAQRQRSGVQARRPRHAVETAQKYDLQVLLTISRTPKWANGGQTPNHPPTNLADLTQFSQMLALRYNGKHAGLGVGHPLLGLERAESRPVPDTAVPGLDDRQPCDLREDLRRLVQGNQGREPEGARGNRRDVEPGAQPPVRRRSDSVAPATFAHLLSIANPQLQFDAWATHPYPTVFALGPTQKVAYPNVALSTMTQVRRRPPEMVRPAGADLDHRVRRDDQAGVRPAASATPAGGRREEGASACRARTRTSRCSSGSSSVTGQPCRGQASDVVQRPRDEGGRKKPAYAAFAGSREVVVGQSQVVAPARFSRSASPSPSDVLRHPGSKIGSSTRSMTARRSLPPAIPSR